MFPSHDASLEAIHHLKQEIDQLSSEQVEALKTATFLGMTPDEAKDYDARRTKILRLVERLAVLEKVQ